MFAYRHCAVRPRVVVLTFALVAAALLGSTEVRAQEPNRHAALSQEISATAGIDPRAITTLGVHGVPGIPQIVTVPIEGEWFTLFLAPSEVRSADYQLLVQLEDGSLVPAPIGETRTMRGSLLEVPGSRAAGSLLEDGLHAVIDLDGQRYWIEPVDSSLAHALPGDYLLYRSDDVQPVEATCGTQGDLIGPEVIRGAGLGAPSAGADGGVAGGTPCVAQLACDADFEYYNDYGTVAAVEARINSVINTVNLQYESQIGVTHEITAIIVRSTEPDPYSSSNAETLLNQFRDHWLGNQTSIQRDVAHLFTGKELNGSTIGIAWLDAVCSSFGYGVVQSDFNGNFSCATDLSAHELGHNWGASHCSCPSYTMNPSITCANNFNPTQTIPSILSYRNSISFCLTGTCPTPGGGPENDDCADAIPFNDGNGDGAILFNTSQAITDGPSTPAGTADCNDSGQPQTHNDIWYTFTATCTGTLTVTTCSDLHGLPDANYDTDLVVYGPYASVGAINCGDANLLANFAGCNDDDPDHPCGTASPYASTVEIQGVLQGEVYLLRVGGWGPSDAGSGWLSVSCAGAITGACCVNGTCSLLTAADCAAAGGAYQGGDSSCSPNPCSQPDGACCFPQFEGGCADVGQALCESANGTFLGPGTVCGIDSDGDSSPDLCDGCPNDPNKFAPGVCGCGTPDDDSDGDGVLDCNDNCPNDPNKTEPGLCGCGIPDADSDGDGVLDCDDGCPNDIDKTEPGVCGCGVPDTDSDGDGVADCIDGCPNDIDKTEPGDCGCGVPDTDSDGDGVADCNDGCPDDIDKTEPGDCGCGVPTPTATATASPDCIDGCPDDIDKTEPGDCGCGVPDTDSDGDGVADCNDGCPNDIDKTEPGDCGCGVPDTDSDGDGVADCNDGCPDDIDKTEPGDCGCGVPDTDSDGDGVADCIDGCPDDIDKTAPGDCGCGVPDTDSDGDGSPDCIDGCPDDIDKTAPGDCGCGVPDTDSDGDGVADCIDGCPDDIDKTAPGDCGCGVPDTDSDGDGSPDCIDGCPDDIDKTEPGDCGCGVPDTDSDGDGVADCIDNCPSDPNKTEPGNVRLRDPRYGQRRRRQRRLHRRLPGRSRQDRARPLRLRRPRHRQRRRRHRPTATTAARTTSTRPSPATAAAASPTPTATATARRTATTAARTTSTRPSPATAAAASPTPTATATASPIATTAARTTSTRPNPATAVAASPTPTATATASPDCNDGCPDDIDKTEPGDCGCGVPDTDSDGDGIADCIDPCPGDPDDLCTLVQACCSSDGSCQDLLPEECASTGSQAQGEATSCDTTSCVPFGACCIDEECSDRSEADCVAGGGVYQGDGSACATSACTPASCAFDLNGDQFIDVQDLVEVITNWGPCAGCPADVNGDGLVNVVELVELISAWGACP